VAAGAIQVASSGQALVLFCEQQTTGGYPKIANVIGADLFKLGQLRPGQKIRFRRVELDEAWESLAEQAKLRNVMALSI
jgi:allophanate hydrolase subunit 2